MYIRFFDIVVLLVDCTRSILLSYELLLSTDTRTYIIHIIYIYIYITRIKKKNRKKKY